MNQPPLASIIINNYNYGRFLRDAIESALSQTYPNLEIIVVDDGSTDNSREIIASYGSRIIPVLKKNEGQASAFNAGFTASRGEAIIFLDADDMLLPNAVENASNYLRNSDIVKVHWHLWEVNKEGIKTGRKHPSKDLREGNFRQEIIKKGTAHATIAPTSANAWSRKFLQAVYPVQECGNKHCADGYLGRLAPIFGALKYIAKPQGYYRVHGENHAGGRSSRFKIERTLSVCEHNYPILQQYLQKQGVKIDIESWKKPGTIYDWMKKMLAVGDEVEKIIAAGQRFILVDEDCLGKSFFPRHQVQPFPQQNGEYAGLPNDAETAIKNLEYLRQEGANFIVFIWSNFWWLDCYSEFHKYLRSQFQCLREDDLITVFSL